MRNKKERKSHAMAEKQTSASAERSPHTVGNSFQCGGRTAEGTIDWRELPPTADP